MTESEFHPTRSFAFGVEPVENIRFIDSETKSRVLDRHPYLVTDAKWASVGQMVIDGRTVYLTKVVNFRRREELKNKANIAYLLFAARVDQPKVADMLGGISFVIGEGGVGWNASVIASNIIPEMRRKGLGKFMYKAAINDLLDVEKVSCVRSDTARSSLAELTWTSICKTAGEGKVYRVGHGSQGATVYETRGPGPIRRRPMIRVRAHRRRR